MQNSHNDGQKSNHIPIYSSRNVNNDYLTLRGIELRTQITEDELYTAIPGEMIDNSIDYMETHGVKDPQVRVIVFTTPLDKEKSIVNITVRNSVNPGSNHVFSKEQLELIYNPNTYYSSKRFYKINRGALGDASKLMLGAPYALADSMNIDLINAGIVYPITHKTSTNGIPKIFHVFLSPESESGSKIIEDQETPSQENYTEVQILMPCGTADIYTIERRLFLYLRDYVIPNTHIEFTFDFPSFNSGLVHFPAT